MATILEVLEIVRKAERGILIIKTNEAEASRTKEK